MSRVQLRRLGTRIVTAQASKGFEPSNMKGPVHDFATSSHRTHVRSKHNISPLCIDVDESNHETQQQTQSISVCQYAPLLQQVPYQLL